MANGNQLVFFDVDTQIDFMLPAGALYVPGAERIIPTLGRLAEFARSRGIPIVSTADAHAPQDPEFRDWPPHCVRGTLGQRKVPETLLPGAAIVPNSPGPLPQGWERLPQVVLEKQTLDAFQAQTIERVLAGRMDARFVVYGVVTEVCVLFAAKGLMARGAKIDLVTDAIREFDPARGRQAVEELRAAGARLVTSDEVQSSNVKVQS